MRPQGYSGGEMIAAELRGAREAAEGLLPSCIAAMDLLRSPPIIEWAQNRRGPCQPPWPGIGFRIWRQTLPPPPPTALSAQYCLPPALGRLTAGHSNDWVFLVLALWHFMTPSASGTRIPLVLSSIQLDPKCQLILSCFLDRICVSLVHFNPVTCLLCLVSLWTILSICFKWRNSVKKPCKVSFLTCFCFS